MLNKKERLLVKEYAKKLVGKRLNESDQNDNVFYMVRYGQINYKNGIWRVTDKYKGAVNSSGGMYITNKDAESAVDILNKKKETPKSVYDKHTAKTSKNLISYSQWLGENRLTESTQNYIQMFPKNGEVNNVLNDFANFIHNRREVDEPTERKFVAKLKSMSGMTNSPISFLQQRIDKREIDYINQIWGRQLIDEMMGIIRKHTTF